MELCLERYNNPDLGLTWMADVPCLASLGFPEYLFRRRRNTKMHNVFRTSAAQKSRRNIRAMPTFLPKLAAAAYLSFPERFWRKGCF